MIVRILTDGLKTDDRWRYVKVMDERSMKVLGKVEKLSGSRQDVERM